MDAKGSVLRALRAPPERSGILLWEKALGNLEDNHDVQRNGQDEHRPA